MKHLIILAFLFIFNPLKSQDVYIGTNFGLQEMVGYQMTFEHKMAFTITQLTVMHQGDQNFFNMKLGFGKQYKKVPISWYIYIPYFNLNFEKKAYNTPFSGEFFYGNVSLCIDVYRNAVVPILKARVPIIKDGKPIEFKKF